MTDSAVPDRQPTIRDVADRAGVSPSAVSKVLRNAYGVSDDMRERVTRAIRQLEYRPRLAARTMRGSSSTIGIQLPEIGSDFFSIVLEAAFGVLAQSAFQPIIAPVQGADRASEAVASLVDRQVDGIIAISPLIDAKILEQLAQRVPLVTIGRHDNARSYDTVVSDDLLGARLVLDHLLQLGHTRIAHLTLHSSLVDKAGNDGHALREHGYRSAMTSARLPSTVIRTGGTEAEAARAVRELLLRPQPPSALFAAHDTLAIGALRAMAELGLHPRDLSIVGYDDTPIASHPMLGLSSVDQFGSALGSTAATLLLERIRGRAEARHHQMTPVLRIRRSSNAAEHAQVDSRLEVDAHDS